VDHGYYEREGTDPHNFEGLILDALELGSGANDRWMKPVHIDGWKVHENSGIEIRMRQK